MKSHRLHSSCMSCHMSAFGVNGLPSSRVSASSLDPVGRDRSTLNDVFKCHTGMARGLCAAGVAPDSVPTRAKAGPMRETLKSLTLLNNSTTYTQCPDGYNPKPEDIPYPRPNTVLEEALAVTVMLSMLTFAALMPFILGGCMAAVLLCRSIPAGVFLVAITLDGLLLPAGKVRPHALASALGNTFSRA